MNVAELNPFIRYAGITNFRPFAGFGYANDCRMFFVLSGKCRLDIEEKTYYLSPHSLAMIPPGIRYKFSEFDESIVLERFDRAEEYVRGIAEEHSRRRLFYRERASGLMKILICDIFRHASTGKNDSDEKIENILSFITSNLETELTCEKLGAKFGYHPYYLSRLIKLHTGKTLKQYIISARIGEAKNLLKSTDLSFSDIAARCGFENAAYFSNAFKAKTKMSPGQYRKARTEYI